MVDTALTYDRPPRTVESAEPGEPPVVARLVVEIRSDGTTTIARAGLSDDLNQHRTVLEARGATPLALAFSLARHLMALSRPLLSRAGRASAVLPAARAPSK